VRFFGEMYKNQLQELAQRSCFNLPSYTCIREGPDHAPRFKAVVNFNGESFESPSYCTTLRQAEHSAAEVALSAFASRGPSNSLALRILDETGVYKNLLQEVSQRVGASLPTYTPFRSGLGHLPVFTCIVELAGITFTGEPAKNKKQAEKNAAMAAWSALKILTQQTVGPSLDKVNNNDEQEHVTVARALHRFLMKARGSNVQFPISFPVPKPRPTNMQPPPATSRILPFICPKSNPPRIRPQSTNNPSTEHMPSRPLRFPAAGAQPYIPVRHYRPAHHGLASPVTIRNAIPVFSAPPRPSAMRPAPPPRLPHLAVAPPVCVRQAVPVFAASPPPVKIEVVSAPSLLPVKIEDVSVPPPPSVKIEGVSAPPLPSVKIEAVPAMPPAAKEEALNEVKGKLPESLVTEELKELKI
jgi:hypothetical protein